MSKTDLKLDWCSHEAAKYAVEKWHYSHNMPAGKIVKIGVWENQTFIGTILFSRGANNNIATPYHLTQLEVCELTRIALHRHASPVSRIASVAIKMLKKQSPELRLIVSYADPTQSHHGGVYQAMNWLYEGTCSDNRTVLIDGKIMHRRSAFSLYGTDKGIKPIRGLFKHKYLYPLDDAMRAQIAPLAKPYPKRDIVTPMRLSSSSKTAIDQIDNSGAIPTQALSPSTHEIEF